MAGVVVVPDPGAGVPTADATSNVYQRDVVGNKTDAAVTTVGTTKSIIAYLKGLVGVTALTSTTSEVGADQQNWSTGTIYQLVAASAAAIRRISFSGTLAETGGAGDTINLFILTGAGGAEVSRAQCRLNLAATSRQSFFLQVQVNLAAGTRVAWKITSGTSGGTTYLGYTIEEA